MHLHDFKEAEKKKKMDGFLMIISFRCSNNQNISLITKIFGSVLSYPGLHFIHFILKKSLFTSKPCQGFKVNAVFKWEQSKQVIFSSPSNQHSNPIGWGG